jgi:hypothetical protein
MVEETVFASGRASLAVPVRHGGRAIAAIAIEGPVLSLDHAGLHEDLDRWIQIVRTIEAMAGARPALFENPFDHLDPNEIVLKSVK